MCYRDDRHKLTASDVGHGIFYFLVVCCMAVGLSLVMEAMSSHPSLEVQQILTAGKAMAGR